MIEALFFFFLASIAVSLFFIAAYLCKIYRELSSFVYTFDKVMPCVVLALDKKTFFEAGDQ